MSGSAATRRPLLSARGAALVMLVGFLLVSALYPARQFLAARARIDELRGREALLVREIGDLSAEVARLGTDDEVERLARRDLGMVRPGETAFAVVGGRRAPQAAAPAPEAPPQGLTEASPRWTSRWWGAVVRAFRTLR